MTPASLGSGEEKGELNPPESLHNYDEELNTASRVKSIVTTKSLVEFPPSLWGKSQLELTVFIFVIGSAGMVSTLAIPSFFPTIPILSDYFDTSIESINLTATIYSVFQGISPLFWAGLSDTVGRRPVLLSCIALAIIANFLLAITNSYAGLFGLRVLQAFGGAPTVSLVSAFVGDITERKTRGGVTAFVTGFQSLGNCFGPLIGGAVVNRWGWRAIFYFLGCHAALIWLLILIIIPETNRHYSGNGSVMPKRVLNQSPYAWYKHKVKGVPYISKDTEYDQQWLPPPHKINLFRWIYLMRQLDTFLVLTPTSIIYTTWYMVLTTMSTHLTNDLHFSTLKVGFCYLSAGVGAIVASVGAGRSMNWNYQRRLRQLQPGEALDIPKVRLELTLWAAVLFCIATLVYGWTFEYNVTFYVPVVMTFFISFGASFFLSTSTVILIDLFPDDSAASTSCVNLTRCLLCAAGLAAVDKMERTMTLGGTYTFLAGICALSWGCIWAEMKYGVRIYQRRSKREHQKQESSKISKGVLGP